MTADTSLAQAVAAEAAPALVEAVIARLTADPDLQAARLLVDVAGAAERLAVSTSRVRDLIADGELEVIEGLGRGHRITVRSLTAYVDRHARRVAA